MRSKSFVSSPRTMTPNTVSSPVDRSTSSPRAAPIAFTATCSSLCATRRWMRVTTFRQRAARSIRTSSAARLADRFAKTSSSSLRTTRAHGRPRASIPATSACLPWHSVRATSPSRTHRPTTRCLAPSAGLTLPRCCPPNSVAPWSGVSRTLCRVAGTPTASSPMR